MYIYYNKCRKLTRDTPLLCCPKQNSYLQNLYNPPRTSPVAWKGTLFQSGTSKPQVLHHPHSYYTQRLRAVESVCLFTATAWYTILYCRSAESFSKQTTKSSICLWEMKPVSTNLTTSSPHWHVMFCLRTSKVTAYSSFLDVPDHSWSKDIMKNRTATFSSFCCFTASSTACWPILPLPRLLLDRARKRPVHLFPLSLDNAPQVKHFKTFWRHLKLVTALLCWLEC